MMKTNYTLLSHVFEGLVGQSISEWRNGYGDSGSFHLGQPVPERSDAAKRERGAWILTIWAASVSLVTSNSAAEESHHPPLALKELHLERFNGMRIAGASVGVDGRATIAIGPSVHIEIVPDDQAAADNDQWTIETDTLGTFAMRSGPTVIKE
jgi:hypothetical protein